MPQNNSTKQVPKHLRKKKKGPAPAHQNTFAFKHNPHSKKSDKIMDLPNVHVCRRCHDKIEWRKKYRKYKPRTQPGKCNICQMKRVMAAYHTICEKCSTGDKAKTIVREHLQASVVVNDVSLATKDGEDDTMNNVEETVEGNPSTVGEIAQTERVTTASSQSSVAGSSANVTTPTKDEGRACCMCVKDFALPDSDDDDDEDDPLNSGKKLTLRQRRTLERQRDAARKKQTKKQNNDDDDDEVAENPDEGKSGGPVDSTSDFEEEEEDNMDTDDESDDPFLRAVGGSDKLLTGEAYQKALMEKQKQQQT